MKTISCLALCVAMIVPLSAQNRTDQEVFNKVSAYLDSGGRVFVIISVKDRLRELIGKANAVMESALEDWADAFPSMKELDYEKILLSLGLHQIDAFGMSSVAEDTGYRNKALIAIDGPRSGLLKLSGGRPKPFTITNRAPSGADIAFEMEIALGTINDYAETLDPLLEPALGAGGVSQFLKRPLPNSSHTIAQALEQVSGRLSGHFILREGVFEPTKDVRIPIPKFDLVLNHSQGEWLYRQLEQAIASLPASEVKREETDEHARFELVPSEPALKEDFRPVVLLNKASGSLHLATNPKALEETLGHGDKLRSDQEFLEVTKQFPKKGNLMGYVSQECLSTIANTYNKLIMEGADESNMPDAARDILQSWLGIKATQATAFVISNLPEGIGYIDRSPKSSLSLLSGPITVAIIVRLAMLSPLMAQSPLASLPNEEVTADEGDEKQTNASGQLEKLLASLKRYARDHNGAYPAKLEDLVPKYLGNKSLLRSDAGPIQYEAGLTEQDKNTSIILYIKDQPNKTVLVGFLQGFAEPMHRWEFDTQLALQRDRTLSP